MGSKVIRVLIAQKEGEPRSEAKPDFLSHVPCLCVTPISCIPPSCISMQYLHLPISHEDSWDLSAWNGCNTVDSPLTHTCTHVHTYTPACTYTYIYILHKHYLLSAPFCKSFLTTQSGSLHNEISVATTNRFQSSTCLEILSVNWMLLQRLRTAPLPKLPPVRLHCSSE